ncbi:gamma-glutamylcyclotransferase [Bosea sp. TWI1241]|jgi:cation transport protein ChaC|uniref:gamma-glutamylcyclotransferase n=1 Tax=Bosea sp. TWI1241 TaxID=3148904 RepID=UPI003207EAD1
MTPTAHDASEDLWVFGYGSLIWRPGFAFAERMGARLHGFHRSLCIYSHVHRGTPETPGLVLGLDRGGICRGVAFRVEADRADETIAYLREREQATAVYLERRLAVRLDDGRRLRALTYVADRAHGQYAGRLPEDTLLALVRQGKGISGENPDYLRRTHAHLHEMGVHDPLLAHLVAALDRG